MGQTSKCSYLWHHACVRPQGEVRPCCQFEAPGLTYPRLGHLPEIMNGEFYQNLRRESMAGRRIAGCAKCDALESLGKHSLRTLANSQWPLAENETAEITPSHIKYLEVFVGDTCNLKCLTCGPDLSTAWRADYHKLGWEFQPADNEFDLVTLVNQLPGLREIKFVGGEPLLAKAHKAILASIPPTKAQDLTLTYFSNLTVLPSAETLSAWRNFARIQFWMSIDGVGPLNEYIRFPSRWEDVEVHVKNLLHHSRVNSNLRLGLHCTVSKYNVFSLPDIALWFRDLGRRIGITPDQLPITFYPLTNPSFLAVQNLPEALKAVACERLNLKETGQARVAAVVRQTGHPDLGEFLQYSRTLDKLRGTDLARTIPQYRDYARDSLLNQF
jgi:MoaA/NifB/PqqE/SkfB family radical SAM enzyme